LHHDRRTNVPYEGKILSHSMFASFIMRDSKFHKKEEMPLSGLSLVHLFPSSLFSIDSVDYIRFSWSLIFTRDKTAGQQKREVEEKISLTFSCLALFLSLEGITEKCCSSHVASSWVTLLLVLR
jgi:hypothetical protein